MISKYLGDTAKHITRAFERASHHGAALFLDEADSLHSRLDDSPLRYAPLRAGVTS